VRTLYSQANLGGSSQRAALVAPHQAGVADNVGSDNRGEAPLLPHSGKYGVLGDYMPPGFVGQQLFPFTWKRNEPPPSDAV
jgi:hypothetical protein